MPPPIRMPDLGVKPLVDTSSGWGRTARSLNRDPRMQRLTNRHWVCTPECLDPLQHAVLLHQVLDRPESELRITGLSALQLYGLPITGPGADMDSVLGYAVPPRADHVERMLTTAHLLWVGSRRKCSEEDARLTKSYGLGRFPGPWGSHLATRSKHSLWLLLSCRSGASRPVWTLS